MPIIREEGEWSLWLVGEWRGNLGAGAGLSVSWLGSPPDIIRWRSFAFQPDFMTIRRGSFCWNPLPATLPIWAEPWGFTWACSLAVLGHPVYPRKVLGWGYASFLPPTQMRLSLGRYLRRSPWCGRRTWSYTRGSWIGRWREAASRGPILPPLNQPNKHIIYRGLVISPLALPSKACHPSNPSKQDILELPVYVMLKERNASHCHSFFVLVGFAVTCLSVLRKRWKDNTKINYIQS